MRKAELHVYGPAFGLPSIDPECLAAIAYVQQVLRPEDYDLVPSSDPSVSPFGALPALRLSTPNFGEVWTAGYGNIVGQLRHSSGCENDLDGILDEKQKADCTAYTSFVESRGLPLLDLSLLVSSENYTNVTRGLLGQLLTWPNTWTVPGKLRDKARMRCEHLGLTGLDVDAAAEEQAQKSKDEQGLTGQIPKSLRVPSRSIRDLLGRGAKGNQFRLAAITEEFFEPLDDLLEQKSGDWLLSEDGPTSLDCLALGYLALMLHADVPQAWLKNALKEKHPKLSDWTEKGVKELSISPALTLPWKMQPARTWTEIGNAVLESFTSSLPTIGHSYSRQRHRSHYPAKANSYDERYKAILASNTQQLLYGKVIASCVGVVASTGILFWAGMLRMPSRAPRTARRDFGAAGAMLGLG